MAESPRQVNMDWDAHLIIDIATALGGLIAGAVGAYIVLRKMRPEIKNIDATTDRVQAESDAAEALAIKTQSESWVMLVKSYQDRLDVMNRRVTELESQVKTLLSDAVSRDIEREKLKARVQELEIERDSLRVRVTELEGEIIRIPDLEKEIGGLREQIVQLGHKPRTGPLGRRDKS